MKLYRITKAKYASTAWTGAGASAVGGRWNSAGHKAVYVAESIALAQLEILVHVESAALLSKYVCYEIEVPETLIRRLDASALPTNWQEDPAPDETQEIGDQWLEGGDALALLVPSTIVPQEINAILNPQHPDYDDLIASAVEIPFVFDPRLSR
tara:strand:+ start:422 stop:883 length:462 start_codon:yes stop_codon:yes gene_type:complete